ncbi:MAG: hypothetical protein RIR11_2028 [Bacteroidota bacterium]|jgi:hypothetical protein
MKKISSIIIGYLLAVPALWAQQLPNITIPDFDPAQQPIAIEVDSGVVIGAVSDYVLIKSLRAQLPTIGKYVTVKMVDNRERHFVQYEIKKVRGDTISIYIFIPLAKNTKGAYYAAGAGTSCTGCERCGPPPQGQTACECCPPISSSALPKQIWLKKVSTALEFSND